MAEKEKTLEEKCPWKGIISRDTQKYGQLYGEQGEKCVKCVGYDKKCPFCQALGQVKYSLN